MRAQGPFQCFVLGRISPNFDLKNMISTYTKDFPREKYGPNSPDFRENQSKSPDFYDKFQKVSQEYTRILVLFYFHIYSVAKSG